MLRPLLLIICLVPALAAADGLNICYHYGCAKHASAEFSDEENAWIAARLGKADSAATERANLKEVVTAMYRIAARNTPIWQDKGGNFNDGSANGRMDCVDHSTNVTTFLSYLQDHGWLKFHTTGKPAWRAPWIINLHYTAVLHDIAANEDWAVDAWFKDFGEPPEVVPLSIWMEGYSP